ncbi:hypothetical protein [uncultured Devosia sp.]|uniref:hypothetical protein n=1 Tax=uncultured Devosia sp. TaxID=211434 RepID=UPI0026086BFF|nr:hypothetical protein [uncultured Devosia sp.]
MPMVTLRAFAATKLDLPGAHDELQLHNHILEPEFHQERYAGAVERAESHLGAFQLGDINVVARAIGRGRQPSYADDDSDPESLDYEGMMNRSGARLDSNGGSRNICALKSNCIRSGYVDLDLARSVERSFYLKNAEKAGIIENDLLINSTGDGTIGRIAVYDKSFPALVDGHISIVRFRDPKLAWYSASYLLSDEGQRQIYRYINGSSGQVEIYPQDIARLWIPGNSDEKITEIANALREANQKHEEFFNRLTVAKSYFLENVDPA